MTTTLILSILLTAASLAALWFWFGCRQYESEIVYLEDVILEMDGAFGSALLDPQTVAAFRDEATFIREWREENTTADD